MMLLEDVRRDATRALPVGTMSTRRAQVFLVVVAAGALAPSGTTNATVGQRSPGWEREPWTRSGFTPDDHGSEVAEEEQGGLVMELRRRTGLTWEKLGELFGVDRRSVHFWASGRPMNAGNRAKLGRILALVRRLPEDSHAVRAWLLSPDANARLPFDLLRDGRYDDLALPVTPATKPFERPKVAHEVLRARAPRPPEDLVGALHDSVHRESSKLRAAIPLKKRT
ncbi:hypothetical protein [Sorangium sp. So ce861]|uniref:hypothetical protein n=1 Tax=Sorangium sp. So ce861 TaxID=3133323 RepID=UPI003F5FFD10